jgi:Tle cognate immunity protein 4 C-terminal domain/Tle cognate immunity protein 4 N-terminal domain
MMFATRLGKSGLHLLVAVSLVSISACQAKTTPMTNNDTQREEKLIARMTTRCIGRHLIDLPEAFVLNSEDATEVDGVKLKVLPMNKTAFDLLLASREAELQREHMDAQPKNPFLKSVIPLNADSLGKVFDRGEATGTLDVSRTLELWGWRQNFKIEASIKATDASDPKYATHSYWKSGQNDKPAKLAQLLRVFEQVRGRAQTEVPTEPGLCIANGFVKGPANPKEQTYIPFHLEGMPDVFFGFHSKTNVREKDTLLERSADIEKQSKEAGAVTVRKGKRALNGVAAEEWLWRGTTTSHVKGTLFMLLANETVADPTKPKIELDFYNGYRIPRPALSDEEKRRLGLYSELTKASLTEAEALAIWDKATATLRPRPNAF